MGWTTPRDWSTGELVTEAMLDQQISGNFNAAFPLAVDAWTAYVPTLTQSATVTKTVTYAKYQRVGRTVIAVVRLDVTGAGTAANNVVIGLPVTAASAVGLLGSGHIYDSSATTRYVLTAIGNTTSDLIYGHDTSGGNIWGTTPSIGLASGDVVYYAITYEAAT